MRGSSRTAGCSIRSISPAEFVVTLALTAIAAPAVRFREHSPLPGFGLAMGVTLTYVGAIILLPIAALIARPWEHGVSGFFEAIFEPRTLAALRLSFTAAALAAAANAVFGLLIA